MKIKTSKGKTYEIDGLLGSRTSENQNIMIRLRSDVPLSVLADDFEGCENIHQYAEVGHDINWTGYTMLDGITKLPGLGNKKIIHITLVKPEYYEE